MLCRLNTSNGEGLYVHTYISLHIQVTCIYTNVGPSLNKAGHHHIISCICSSEQGHDVYCDLKKPESSTLYMYMSKAAQCAIHCFVFDVCISFALCYSLMYIHVHTYWMNLFDWFC